MLIIFDLDGTLVDSERLCNQAFLDLLPELRETVDELVLRYRGKKLAEILSDLEKRNAIRLTEEFERVYRQRVATLFDAELKAVEGVTQMLSNLRHRYCIASSGPPEKIKHALSVSGLAPYFDDNLFSSYVIKSWKPDPGLFLHAAKAMGFTAEQCIVVEDSAPGLQAAAAAGMHALHFSPGVETGNAGNAFSSMAELSRIIGQLGSGG